MINAFYGIHGKIAFALAGSGIAVAAALSVAEGAPAHPARSASTALAGPAAALAGPAAALAGPVARRVLRTPALAASGAARPKAGSHAPVLPVAFRRATADMGVLMSEQTRALRSPRQFARWLLTRRFHWRRWQFRYLNLLWDRESGWNSRATNPYSGAYGIPQAVPADKMASAGPDWRHSARTQIRWGMRYIRARYHTPYWAWRHEVGCGWY